MGNPLLEIIEDLDKWNERANNAAKLLANDCIISHSDLDPKNIMWDNNCPTIIDWEAAGFIQL
ncbi:MAG TPA: phosphotransferase [Candidatus Paenibacillus intestinavium]|nr:phosphotransferase [Candidatus Paenibacillus intestinavium]